MATKKIRILLTISNFNTAGSGKVVYDLAKNLDSNRFEVEIACGSRDGKFFKVIESLGLPIHIFQTKTAYKPYHTLIFRIWKISKFYKRQHYDIVHSWQWSNDWTEALASRLVGVKWLYTKKSMSYNNRHWHIKSFFADYIITINDRMFSFFPKKKQQKLIPLGVDTKYFNPELFEDQLSNKEFFYIITVANLVPIKKIEHLIFAFKQLNDKKIKLIILGGNDSAYGQAMIDLTKSLHLEDQIVFTDKIIDVRPFLLNADLYVITSEKEGMPMALLEAMSMGLPVIGADSPGINYILRDFENLIFPYGDPIALADMIRDVQNLQPEERLQIGKGLRQYCIKNFSMKAFITNHENLYKQLVER